MEAIDREDAASRDHPSTKDAEAPSAVQEFLRCEVFDHQTGDAPDVTKLP